MIRVTILYPNKPGITFDRDYYLNKHMPMSQRIFGDALKGVSVEFGVNGGPPGSAPPYIATCHFLFDSLEAFYNAFMPNAATLQGDIPQYTDVEPVIQIGEVKISQ
jgi:uncharacterized protein (TIGR02118 family)